MVCNLVTQPKGWGRTEGPRKPRFAGRRQRHESGTRHCPASVKEEKPITMREETQAAGKPKSDKPSFNQAGEGKVDIPRCALGENPKVVSILLTRP